MSSSIFNPHILSNIASFLYDGANTICRLSYTGKYAYSIISEDPACFVNSTIKIGLNNRFDENFEAAVKFAKKVITQTNTNMTIQVGLPGEFQPLQDSYVQKGFLNLVFLPQFSQQMDTRKVCHFISQFTQKIPHLLKDFPIYHLSMLVHNRELTQMQISDVTDVVSVQNLEISAEALNLMRYLDSTEEIVVHGDWTNRFFSTLAKKVTFYNCHFDPTIFNSCPNMRELNIRSLQAKRRERQIFHRSLLRTPIRKLDRLVVKLPMDQITAIISIANLFDIRVGQLVIEQDDFFMEQFINLSQPKKKLWDTIVFTNLSMAEQQIVRRVFRGMDFAFENPIVDSYVLDRDDILLVKFARKSCEKVRGPVLYELEAFANNPQDARSIRKLRTFVEKTLGASFKEALKSYGDQLVMYNNVISEVLALALKAQLRYNAFASKESNVEPILQLNKLLCEYYEDLGNSIKGAQVQKAAETMLRDARPLYHM